MLDQWVLLDILEQDCAHMHQIAKIRSVVQLSFFLLLCCHSFKLFLKLLMRVCVLEQESTSLNNEAHVLLLLLELDNFLMHVECFRSR